MGAHQVVEVVAADPILQAGVESTLRLCPGIGIAGRDAPAGQVITAVVVDVVDDQAVRTVASVRSAGRLGIVLLATSLDVGDVVRVIQAGVSGVLLRREASPHRLMSAIRSVAAGEATMPPELLAALFEHARPPWRAGDAGGSALWLDDREKAVLRMLGDGHETGEIARSLAYSPRTVTAIVHDIIYRHRLRNRAHAVAFALKAGLI